MIQAPLAPSSPATPIATGIVTSDSRVSALCHESMRQALDRCSSAVQAPMESGTGPVAVNGKANFVMPKVRVLLREDTSTGQVSPSSSTSISDGPRPLSETGTVPQRNSHDDAVANSKSSAESNSCAPGDVDPPIFDSANPQVNIHQFIVDTINQQKDRLYLLQVEQHIVDHLEKERELPLVLPAASSYHRLLLHRVGTYFGMDHVTVKTDHGVSLQATSKTRLPKQRFRELIVSKPPSPPADLTVPTAAPAAVPPSPRIILKRQPIAPGSSAQRSGSSSPTSSRLGGSGAAGGEDKKPKTMEEREAEYEEHRKRIFGQQPVIATPAETSSDGGGSSAVTITADTSGSNNRSSPEHEIASAVHDSDYDRSLPLSSSDSSLPGGMGGGSGKVVRAAPRRTEASNASAVPAPIAFCSAGRGWEADNILWKTAGPGVLQTDANNTSCGGSRSSSCDVDQLRHRLDKHSIGSAERSHSSGSNSNTGRHHQARHQSTMRNGHGSHNSGKPHCLLSLPNQQQQHQQQQHQQQQQWWANSAASNGAGSIPRGLMPIPGGPVQHVPALYGTLPPHYVHESAMVAPLANTSAFLSHGAVGGGYISPSSSMSNMAAVVSSSSGSHASAAALSSPQHHAGGGGGGHSSSPSAMQAMSGRSANCKDAYHHQRGSGAGRSGGGQRRGHGSRSSGDARMSSSSSSGANSRYSSPAGAAGVPASLMSAQQQQQQQQQHGGMGGMSAGFHAYPGAADYTAGQFYMADGNPTAAPIATGGAGMIGNSLVPDAYILPQQQQQQQQAFLQLQQAGVSMAAMPGGNTPAAAVPAAAAAAYGYQVMVPYPRFPVMDIAVYEVYDISLHYDVVSELQRRGANVHTVDGAIFAILAQDSGRKLAAELQAGSGPAHYKLRFASTLMVHTLVQKLRAQTQLPMPTGSAT